MLIRVITTTTEEYYVPDNTDLQKEREQLILLSKYTYIEENGTTDNLIDVDVDIERIDEVVD